MSNTPGQDALRVIGALLVTSIQTPARDIEDIIADHAGSFLAGLAVGLQYPEYAKALMDRATLESGAPVILEETAKAVVEAAPLEGFLDG